MAKIINCLEDPYNLRLALDALWLSMQEQLEKLPEDETLIVLAIEDHIYPTHVLLQLGILQLLVSQKISTAVGYELAHDYAARHVKSREIMPFDGLGISERTQNLFAYLTHPTEHAPLSHKAVLNFCVKSDISVSFNDMSLGKDDESIAKTADVMAERNSTILNRASEHVKDFKPRVYVQMTGTDHAFGNPKYPYKDSLPVKFARAGFKVITIMPRLSSAKTSTPPSIPNLNVIEVHNLAEDWFSDRMGGEKTVIDQILKESGMDALSGP